jgi:hypothetical protein
MGFDVKVRGSVNVSPLPLDPESLRKGPFALDLDKTYQDVDGGTFSIAGSPVEIELGGTTLLRLIGLRSIDPLNPILTVELTTPASGSPQVFKLSDLLLLHNPAVGSEVTVLRVTGPGRIEFVVAGSPPP